MAIEDHDDGQVDAVALGWRLATRVVLVLAGIWIANMVLAPLVAQFVCRQTGVASFSYKQAGFGAQIVCSLPPSPTLRSGE